MYSSLHGWDFLCPNRRDHPLIDTALDDNEAMAYRSPTPGNAFGFGFGVTLPHSLTHSLPPPPVELRYEHDAMVVEQVRVGVSVFTRRQNALHSTPLLFTPLDLDLTSPHLTSPHLTSPHLKARSSQGRSGAGRYGTT